MCSYACLKESGFCEYKSTRFIRVRNPKLVMIYYCTMILVLLYVVLFTVIIEKGYQHFGPVVGTTSAKLKGTASTDPILDNISPSEIYDAMDLVVPNIEENAFFLTLSYQTTPNQTRGFCAGNDDVQQCALNDDTACIPLNNTYSPESQGVYTGKCSSEPYPGDGNYYCEMKGWCPLEIDERVNLTKLYNTGEFTVFVKVDVEFPDFDKTRSNTLSKNETEPRAPVYGYNLWTVNQIFQEAMDDDSVSVLDDGIWNYGAIVLMASKWECNFDRSIDNCNPDYSFQRIDGEVNSISNGFNFRSTTYSADMESRLLRKLVGFRTVFIVEGRGGRFNIVALSVTFGAGLAYLAVASLITDVFLERFMKHSDFYEGQKNRVLDDETIAEMAADPENQDDLVSESDIKAAYKQTISRKKVSENETTSLKRNGNHMQNNNGKQNGYSKLHE